MRHTQYDAQTGAVTKSIVDVDTSRTADFNAQSLPSGWATPAGGGLHLVTTHEVDRLGRITKATDPNGNITFTVYNDVNHSPRTYVGLNTATLAPTGPITVSRRDLSGTYTESLTYSAAAAVDSQGRPTATEPITNLQSLTRSLVNAAGQVIAVDRYTNLDGLARLTGAYVGTDDSTTNGFKWKPSNAAPTSNMAQVAAYEYDNGGVGNGNLTKATQFPGGGAAPRVVQNAHDCGTAPGPPLHWSDCP